ncbi:MAG: hypothetical protein R3B09_25980 [Nannocystaceae bacterium]
MLEHSTAHQLAVQQHEYCRRLQRVQRDYEVAQERAILRTLRQRWLERVCGDKVERRTRFALRLRRHAIDRQG